MLMALYLAIDDRIILKHLTTYQTSSQSRLESLNYDCSGQRAGNAASIAQIMVVYSKVIGLSICF